jgi:F0F1-type ATP synthase assembly protein I
MTNASAGKREKNKDGGLPCVPTACVDGYKLESGKCIESQAEEKPENTENPGKPETIETPQPAGSECDKKTAGYEIFEGNCITTAQKAQIERQREEERKQQAKNALQSQISNHAATISGIKTAHSGEKASVWKNNEGKFNTTRLLSDSIAGVALGTVGGLVVNKVVKKNQLESGFEDIGCHIGSERVADFDDQFEVDGALDRAGCLAYNSGRGNVYVWASKSSVGTNYSGMVEDAQNPDNNGCYVRIDIKSDNAKISVADIQPRWFMVGQGITCGSWTNKDALRDRILKSKKSARTWATIGGAVGGAGVGVGAMELFGNKLIGGKVQGQKSLSEEDLLYSQMSESERAQYQAANNELRRLCTELKSAGGSAAECN